MSQTLYVAANLTDLRREATFHSELVNQVYNGMGMTVLEEKEKFCRVKLASDGYEGWAYRPYLTEQPPSKPTHVVSALTAGIFAEADAHAVHKSLLLGGTQISVVDQRGEWSRIQPAGQMLPAAWVKSDTLRPLNVIPPIEKARQQLVEDARRFTGVCYLWGGNSAFGIDCSGLVMTLHRMICRTIPRDARLQFPVGKEVQPPFKAGDLFFFRGNPTSDRITHVGMSVGGWNMIHSSRSRNGVYEEDIQMSNHYPSEFAGARSFLDL
jgi:cell wall-associated NlpC family hydrolase